MGRAKSATFGNAFDLYAQYARRLKSYDEIIGLRNRYLKHLENRKLTTISRSEVQALLYEIGEKSGETAANRAIELISAVYNRAVRFEIYEGRNPAELIDKFTLRSRERYLLPKEVEPFFASVDSCKSKTVRDFIYMCTYTAARSGKVMSMEWKDIDLESAVWHVNDDKNGDDYLCALIPQAIALLESRITSKHISPYVFPASFGPGHMTNPRKTWYDILARAGMTDFRIHDLRRSHASWQLKVKTPYPVIGKTLNHRDLTSTLTYARADDPDVRQAMIGAMDAMFAHRHPQAV